MFGKLRNLKIESWLHWVAFSRFGAQVTLPGIDATQLGNLAGQTKDGIGLIDMFTGGAFSQASVFLL
jgi:preprotein translocase subunit SecY